MRRLLIAILFAFSGGSSMAISIGSMLTDHYNRPVHIFAKKSDNDGVIITIARRDKFNNCAVIFGATSTDNGYKCYLASLRMAGESNSKPFYDRDLGFYIQEFTIKNELQEHTPHREEWATLEDSDNALIKVIVHVQRRNTPVPTIKEIEINFHDLQSNYSLVYESAFEVPPSAIEMDQAGKI